MIISRLQSLVATVCEKLEDHIYLYGADSLITRVYQKLENNYGYLRFQTNIHKHPYLSALMCKLGRHDFEWSGEVKQDDSGCSAVLYCFYCEAGRRSFCSSADVKLPEPDFLDELVDERTKNNPEFPKMVKKEEKKRAPKRQVKKKKSTK